METIKQDMEKYVKDPRIPCKYGSKCYQKNQMHNDKYKHPPKRRTNLPDSTRPAKKAKIEQKNADDHKNDVQINDTSKQELEDSNTSQETSENVHLQDVNSYNAQQAETETCKENTNVFEGDFDPKQVIKTKFLVDMPEDFYSFWDFCKKINSKEPQNALQDFGLILVGPYDILAGKFSHEIPAENYLIHWRYYYDPPEFHTVLKGDKKGYHIGYFRDSPDSLPEFLASNCSEKDGEFSPVGDNIFAAVNLYLEDCKKNGNPFLKMKMGSIQKILKETSEKLNLNLASMTPKMRERNKKILTRTFNKLGIIVPYNKKTQLGYRSLAISNKELKELLGQLKTAPKEKQPEILAKLQPAITYASIALDECDFGTGLELGLDILYFGVECLNSTAKRFLSDSYRLLNREAFAKIAEAHLNSRRKGIHLNML